VSGFSSGEACMIEMNAAEIIIGIDKPTRTSTPLSR